MKSEKITLEVIMSQQNQPQNSINFSFSNNEVCVYLSFLQNLITRMNTNSMHCKILCITTMAALFAVFAASKIEQTIDFALCGTIIYTYLDVRYLALERKYRKKYTELVKNIHSNSIKSCEIFNLTPQKYCICDYVKTFFSWSILPVYLFIFICIFLFK